MGLPGNSVRDVGERMNGGAVRDDKSPVKLAKLDSISHLLFTGVEVARTISETMSSYPFGLRARPVQ